MGSGWQVALAFCALGILWLIVIDFTLGVVAWLRRLVG